MQSFFHADNVDSDQNCADAQIDLISFRRTCQNVRQQTFRHKCLIVSTRIATRLQVQILTMLWANSADDISIFFIFPRKENLTLHANIVSLGDHLHEVSDPIF